MRRLFFVFLSFIALTSCSSDDNEKVCDLPPYGNEYFDNANVNSEYPCVVNACGQRVCDKYDDIKDQYRNYYMSSPCQKEDQ